MPKLKRAFKKPISSLFSLSADCVASNLILYENLNYLPSYIKPIILRKLLRGKSQNVNKLLSDLIYPDLNHINLSSINVDDGTLKVLKSCIQLTEINLRNCENQDFSSESLMIFLKQTSKLLVLDISFCKQFNDDVITCLSINCPNLRELLAESCSFTDDGLANLAQNNKKLECLTVSNNNISGEGISKAVENKNWQFLRELRLDNCCKVTDDALKIVVENCSKIEILTFFNCDIGDETSIFQDISKTCKKLKQLHWTVTW
ncbi:F-box/LRR-repeat protein 20-like isoform X2 [Tribolium madens]|uniref:F-box/LRR-repeat protein 20-like isoform X2 n=1 Tax=Tribolium madens TaxID=41895 RepID=UPI001CF75214|nr:F-box/LRR-repeat protein 20-like isoform X2 [Tribolium madens]